MGLKQYQSKRDFRETSEPRGQSNTRRRIGALRFVIQKHAASHLHYDFRLEMEGVLKSWAVPKGFPVKRGDKRLAVEVEDHPIEYGGFEGTIPPGNYGAGTVMLWDRGTYSVFGDDPLGSLKSGKLHLVLEGTKLKGEWTLVRMRRFEGPKPQWLLLKSGEDLNPWSARAEDRSVLSNRSMDQIAHAANGNEWHSDRQVQSQAPPATRRRLKPRASSSGGGNGLPKLNEQLASLPVRRPVFVEPMKALLAEKLPKGPQWLYEIKFDGVRALAIKNKTAIELISRSGKDLGTKYGQILNDLKEIPAGEAILDGEVVAVDSQGRSAFQLLQSYQTAGRTKPPLFYYVFDALQLEGKDLTGLPLLRRKELARQLVLGMRGSVRFSANISADSEKLVSEMKARGLEGLIAKKKDSPYEPGQRSGAWVKFKWTNEQEFVIGGYTRPKGARSHFGAILVGYYHAGQLRFAAKVGTGFNEQTLHSLYEKFQKLAQPDCPFTNLPERSSGLTAGLGPAEMRRCTWLRPELVCQVRFAEWTRDNHLRQPAFLGLRDDKSPRDVGRERAKA